MQKLLILFVILPFIGDCQSDKEIKQSDSLSHKGWEIIKANRDYSDNIQNSKVKEALICFTDALKLNSKNIDALLGKGSSHYYLKEFNMSLKSYNAVIKLNSNETAAYIDRAITYMATGDTSAAIRDYRLAKRIAPDDYDIDQRLGTAFVNQKEYAKAIYYFTEAISHGVNTVRVYHNRSIAYRAYGFESIAIKDLTKAIELDTTIHYSLFERGNIYFIQSKYNEALKDYNKSLTIDSLNYSLRLQRGICFERLKQFTDAEQDYTKLTMYYPKKTDAFYNLGLLYKDKDTMVAMKYFTKAIQLDEKFAAAYYERGLIYKKQKKTEEAIKEFNKALGFDTLYYFAINEIGNIYYSQKNYYRALEQYEKTLRIAPKFSGGYSNRANVHDKHKQYEAAKRDYFTSITLDTMDAVNYFNMGTFYSNLQNTDSAIIFFTKAISIDKDYSHPYHNRGRAYEHKNDKKKALEDFTTAIKIDSLYWGALNSRGMLYSELNEPRLAIADLLKCIRIDPEGVYSYNNLANCYYKINMINEACKYWKMALDHGYKYEAKWKEEYGIDDPVELIKKHCE